MKIYIEPRFTNQISEDHEHDHEPAKPKTNLKLIILVIVFILACLMCILMVDSLPNPKREYAFNLPLTQFGCLHYRMSEGEIFSNWKIEQPTIIHVAKNSNIDGIVMFNICNWF